MTILPPNTSRTTPALQIDVTLDMAVYKNIPNRTCRFGLSEDQVYEELYQYFKLELANKRAWVIPYLRQLTENLPFISSRIDFKWESDEETCMQVEIDLCDSSVNHYVTFEVKLVNLEKEDFSIRISEDSYSESMQIIDKNVSKLNKILKLKPADNKGLDTFWKLAMSNLFENWILEKCPSLGDMSNSLKLVGGDSFNRLSIGEPSKDVSHLLINVFPLIPQGRLAP